MYELQSVYCILTINMTADLQFTCMQQILQVAIRIVAVVCLQTAYLIVHNLCN